MSEVHPQSGARVLTLIACRVLALYVLFWVAPYLSTTVYFVSQSLIPSADPTAAAINRSMIAGPGLQAISYFLGFTVLWFAAPWLARKIVSKSADDKLSFSVSTIELAVLVASAVGLYSLAKGILPLVNLITKSVTRPVDLFATDGVLAMAYLGFGAALLVKRHRLAEFLVARRSPE